MLFEVPQDSILGPLFLTYSYVTCFIFLNALILPITLTILPRIVPPENIRKPEVESHRNSTHRN